MMQARRNKLILLQNKLPRDMSRDIKFMLGHSHLEMKLETALACTCARLRHDTICEHDTKCKLDTKCAKNMILFENMILNVNLIPIAQITVR